MNYHVIKVHESLKGNKISPIMVSEHKPSAIKFAVELSKELLPGRRVSYLVTKEIAVFDSGKRR